MLFPLIFSRLIFLFLSLTFVRLCHIIHLPSLTPIWRHLYIFCACLICSDGSVILCIFSHPIPNSNILVPIVVKCGPTHSKLFEIVNESSQKFTLTHRGAVTDQHAKSFGSCHGHIHTLFVWQKSDLLIGIRSYHWNDDDLFFATLKSIHRRNLNFWSLQKLILWNSWSPYLSTLNFFANFRNLGRVGRNNSNIFLF